jgi:hypothetical protein
VTLLAVLALAPTARADRGDLTVGGGAIWTAPRDGRALGAVEWGLTDALAGRFEAGVGGGDRGTYGVALVGPTLSADVWTWVPALSVLGGLRAGDGARGTGVARLELRRFVSLRMWVGVGGALTWTRGDELAIAASLALFHQL